jgi:hypothetical protein
MVNADEYGEYGWIWTPFSNVIFYSFIVNWHEIGQRDYISVIF